MRVPSTVAQFAAAGVSLAFEAASIVAWANSSSPSSDWSDVRAGVRPFSARMPWYSSLSISATMSRARSWLGVWAATAMSEPPSSTGAGPPSEPGSAKTPTFSARSGQPASGSVSRPMTQPGRDIMPILPAQNGVTGSASLASAGAPDASSKRVWKVVRPSIDSGEARVPAHPSPSAAAKSPPASHRNAAPSRQSWPGSQ